MKLSFTQVQLFSIDCPNEGTYSNFDDENLPTDWFLWRTKNSFKSSRGKIWQKPLIILTASDQASSELTPGPVLSLWWTPSVWMALFVKNFIDPLMFSFNLRTFTIMYFYAYICSLYYLYSLKKDKAKAKCSKGPSMYYVITFLGIFYPFLFDCIIHWWFLS